MQVAITYATGPRQYLVLTRAVTGGLSEETDDQKSQMGGSHRNRGEESRLFGIMDVCATTDRIPLAGCATIGCRFLTCMLAQLNP